LAEPAFGGAGALGFAAFFWVLIAMLVVAILAGYWWT
jgi:hypothetical protein